MGLELYKLTWSEWDMPHQVCTRIDPVLMSQNENEVSGFCANQETHLLPDHYH
jgi:hypothetical protein